MIVLSVVFEAITVHGPKFITGREMWFSLKEIKILQEVAQTERLPLRLRCNFGGS